MCNKSSSVLICKRPCTFGLHWHQLSIQKLELHKKRGKVEASNQDSPPKRQHMDQPLITERLNNRLPQEETMARLAAEDGFSIHVIMKSSFIHSALRSEGMTLPKNTSDVLSLIKKCYMMAKNEVAAEIEALKKHGKNSATALMSTPASRMCAISMSMR